MPFRTVTRSLTLLAIWMLHACVNAPTASESERAAPETEVAPVESSEAVETTGDTPRIDALLGWALDLRETKADNDARIAHAILQLTDDRKEHQP